MKTKEEILEFIDKGYKENTEDAHIGAKDMARSYLEHCNGGYDEARTMALAIAMACKLTYELLTKIQSFEEMAGKEQPNEMQLQSKM